YQDQIDIKKGVEKNFSVVYTVDKTMTKKFIEANNDKLVQKVKENSLKRENGQFVFVKGKNGITIDFDKSADNVLTYMETSFDGVDDSVELATIVEEPRGSEEDLKSVKDVLGTFTTNYSASSAPRANNVRNGASLINGTVLYPGEVFSVAKALNPMTAENGYQQAPSYENGTTVMTYGGGICQVSTTLYNAVIRAELEVVERSSHSMIVSYVKPSEDAAIAGDTKDFKFKNNQDTPVFIESSTDGGLITFNIYGKEVRDPSRTVEFESEVLSTTEPKNVFVANGSAPVGSIVKTSGSPHTGYVAQLVKVVKENGKEISREVFNSSRYRATNNEYAVGTKSESSEATAAMYTAISSGDYGTIQSAASKWAGATAPEEETKEEPADKKQETTETTTDDSKQPEETTEEKPAEKSTTEQTEADTEDPTDEEV
ncbi:MAG: VanW family protein, partial [Lachnospiraceae bacterium]|nr:VanW family protein [Lachnospiraceae bacterium]